MASRQTCNYVLRLIYLLLLAGYLTIIWVDVDFQKLGPTQIVQLAETGRQLTQRVLWYQFFITQLLAVVMLSTAISDEINHRTLGVLMTTPITGLQIVVGKLTSKLMQMLLFMAISLPLLGSLRVLGGVPWSMVMAGWCITVSAMLLAGTLSLFLSIREARAYRVIFRTLAFLCLFYFVLPMFLILPFQGRGLATQSFFHGILLVGYYLNPAWALSTVLNEVPTRVFGLSRYYWQVHCLVMLGLFLLLLSYSACVVRTTALRQAVGSLATTRRWWRRRRKVNETEETAKSPLRPVVGPPIVWKELRTPLIMGGKRQTRLGLTAAVVVQLFLYLYYYSKDLLAWELVHSITLLVYLIFGLLATLVMAATAIPREKETQSWPILCSTCVTNWELLGGKAVGVVRRSLPIWLFMVGHLLLFTLLGYIHPVAILQVLVMMIGLILFLTGSGLYFGSRFQKSTSAVVANLMLAMMLWVVIPGVLAMLVIFNRKDDAIEYITFANPVFNLFTVMMGTVGDRQVDSGDGVQYYRLITGRDLCFVDMLRWQSICWGSYMAIGIACLVRARFCLRRRIFG